MPCKNHTYKGDYGFTANGTIVPPPGTLNPEEPFAVVGRFTADGKGNITGSQTRNFAGAVVPETYTETYTIKPDCTGTSVKVTSTGKTVNFAFVVLHHGKTIIGVETDKGNVVTFRAERME